MQGESFSQSTMPEPDPTAVEGAFAAGQELIHSVGEPSESVEDKARPDTPDWIEKVENLGEHAARVTIIMDDGSREALLVARDPLRHLRHAIQKARESALNS